MMDERTGGAGGRRFDAVVFDMDGLMFDTEDLFFAVADSFMIDHGARFTDEMMAAMIGRRAAEAGSVFHTIGNLHHLPVLEIMTEVKARFHQRMLADSHTMPGLRQLLDHLESRGIPRAVATSSSRKDAEALTTHHGIRPYFSFLVTSEDVSRGKPDPEIYRTASARLGVDPVRVLVLEDSAAGLQAARAAGAFAVGVPHRYSPPEVIAHADMIVASLHDERLLSLLP
jgi:HAD superfamily hydrolase (TIGR01509 family)